MSRQLDILALEPFYGGGRRHMLETLIHYSRHRWTLLKLPPRRIERRLTAAAHWFAEQLSRHWVGRVDLLFTSEAMNLADLYRLMPSLLKKPSVVYFHSNQLPHPSVNSDNALDVANLNTAAAAQEIWFNSLYHLRDFFTRASTLVQRHPELSSRNPMSVLSAKAQLMAPPVDFNPIHELLLHGPIPRKKRTIFVDTRDANVKLLNAAFSTLARRGEKFELITVGPVEELAPDLPRTTLPETDELAHVKAQLASGIFVSAKDGCPCDYRAVRALAAGCWPVVPNSGCYPEIIPARIHGATMYDGTASALTSRLQDVWHLELPGGHEQELAEILHKFDPMTACRAIDERLEELCGTQPDAK
ncbi:MAG: DUF3524 domain-containing protein [Tepidisphaeraceae bacterium]